MNHFKRKVGDLKDNHRIGRPITETIRTKIERFWDVIENNSLWTYDEIEAETTLSHGTLEEIIHEDLKMKKLAFR